MEHPDSVLETRHPKAHSSSIPCGARTWQATILGLLAVALLAVLDYATGSEISFSIFYLAPVLYVTWRADRPQGVALALIAAIVWGGIDLAAGSSYSTPLIPVWNSLVRLGFFLVCLWLLHQMKLANSRLSELAHTDALTGVANTRSFYLHLAREIERLRRYRHPFTLAYADLDQFKAVNDQLGHAAGDELLKGMAQRLKGVLREADVLARLGGDEFALLLPETDEAAAVLALERASEAVTVTVRSFAPGVPGVGVTIGALVFNAPPDSADAAIRAADEAMYWEKRSGKGGIRIARFPARPVERGRV